VNTTPILITKKLNRHCPICRNDQGRILHTQKFALPADHILPNEYDVIACTGCGFVYADTVACQADYGRFYRECSKYEDISLASGGGARESDRHRLQETAAAIAARLPSAGSSILDIGCANGGLLHALRALSFNNLTGLDPSPVCVDHVSQAGIACHEGGIFEQGALLAGIKYDCIILSHVLEHVYDLELAVGAVTGLLNQNGLLYVEVPDASRYPEHFVVPYYYFDCEHINHFSETSLENLFQRSGIVPLSVLKKTIVVSTDNTYPAVGVFLTKADPSQTEDASLTVDSAAQESVISYVAMSAAQESHAGFRQLAQSREPVVIWGAGSYTLRLLESTDLGKCAIIAFIDKDSSKQGKELCGVSIHPPQKLYELSCLIVVCAALYSAEIVSEINSMGLPNRVVVA